jgi:hypothetical protein
MDVENIINACEDKFRSVGLTGLTGKERLVVLVHSANSEVELGGVAAFFNNATAIYARDVVDALIQLGAMDEAAAINQGRELLRNRSWEDLTVCGQFERLTDKFLASMPGVLPRLAAFVEQHCEELESTAQESCASEART